MNVILTGASRGIGFELVKLFSKDKENKIISISRNLSSLKKIIYENKNTGLYQNILPLEFDLTQDNYENFFLPEAISNLGEIDILINNAGKLINKPFEEFTSSDFDDIFNTNVKSAVKLIQLLIPYFASNSHIVNISSMGGFQGSVKFPGLSLYSASKGALAILTECLAEEFKHRSIKVNCLALGAVQTEMLSEAFPNYKADISAEEMAKYIKDFSINGHKYHNGKIIPVAVTTP